MTHVAYYVCAHQDDWQLFMTPRAYSDLQWPRDTCKIVFIYLTAGDANKSDDAYWQSREMGALNSIRSLRGQDLDWNIQYQNNTKTIRYDNRSSRAQEKEVSHQVIRHEMLGNTVSYFLRIRENDLGGGKGEFRDSSTSVGTAPTTYANWNDLVQTLAAIFRDESYGVESRSASWVNYVNPRPFMSHHHRNHLAAGRCAEAAIDHAKQHHNDAGKVNFAKEVFCGYEINCLEPNLSSHDLEMKTLAFDNYVIAARNVYADYPDWRQTKEFICWKLRQYTVTEAKQAGLSSNSKLVDGCNPFI